jgi:hypothetical protein
MVRALLSGILLLVLCGPAVAEQSDPAADMLSWLSGSAVAHFAITLIGMMFAVRLALEAFARRSVPLADVPTIPRYMTNPQQYRLGSWLFVIFACGFFFLLVYEHRQVVEVASVFQKELPEVVGEWVEAAKGESPSYLLIIAGIGAIYLYLLTREAQWNVLLMMRNTIQSWISIPELARRIVAQIQLSLHVPAPAIAELVGGSSGLSEQDFRKDRNTPDRQWAETCYMKWWLTPRQEAGEDATFFADENCGFEKLLRDLEETSLVMRSWRSGGAADPAIARLADGVKELHKRFARLIACYLIYRNASREELCAQARDFGVDVTVPPPENPLRYWIVYAITLIASVYVGVYAPAIVYDWFSGQGFNIGEYPDRALAWAMYSLALYGLAIIATLLLRFVARSLGNGVQQSHLIMYCWTFLVAFVVGPFGLAVVVHYFAAVPRFASWSLLQVFYEMLKWGLAPALVAVYISYYLDRQTYRDLPDIDHSRSTFGWRLLNCFGFAALNVLLLLPPLLSLKVEHSDANWDSAKLRFIAAGTAFFIALGLALAAQFALRKGTQAADPVLTARQNA